MKRSRFERHQNSCGREELAVQREKPILFIARPRDQAICYFLLQHEYGTAKIRVGDHASNDRGSDVVWQIANRTERAGGKGGGEGVGVEDDVAESVPQRRRE